jgi:hypothetical protein
VSATQLQASIAVSDIAAVGTAAVTVSSPAPGGGVSSSASFTVSPAPTIAVSATSVAGGTAVTATLVGGGGGITDWLSLAPTNAANSSYTTYTYVGNGITTRTWTVTMPTTQGTYEFRYFPNGGNTRAATSPVVTVQPGGTPGPSIASLSPSSVVAGSAAFSLTVNGAGFTSQSVVRWNGSDRTTTFVGATKLVASITAADVVAAGTVPITVFATAGTSPSVPFTVATPPSSSSPSLAVNPTAVAGGSNVTVTLTNGLGGAGDWLAFAPSTAANSTYTQFIYVGAGVTTRTWSVTAPPISGPYEFRLFANSGYTRLATSPVVTVTAMPPSLTVSAGTVAPGAAVTVTLSSGAGGAWDWLALAASSAPNTSYVTYTFVGGGMTSRTWTVTMPSTPGTYEFRLFLNNGYARAATSPPVTVRVE